MSKFIVYNVAIVGGVSSCSIGAGMRFGASVGLMVAGALAISLTLFAASRS